MDDDGNNLIKKIYANQRKSDRTAAIPEGPQPGRKRNRWAVIFLIVFLAFFTTGFMLAALSRYVLFKTAIDLLALDQPRILPPTNVLLLGYDEGHRSDSIMVVHLTPVRNEIDLVSIPRDIFALIPGRGMGKINAASAYGGAELSRSAVEAFLNIRSRIT